MPGLTMMSFADINHYGDYELHVNYPGQCPDLLPDGRSVMATTSVIHHTEGDRVYVEDYYIDVELVLSDSTEDDVISYYVDSNNKDFALTSNDQGKTGDAMAIVKFYVEGEFIGTIETPVRVGETIWYWPDNLPGTHEEFYGNPEIGNVIDFSGFAVKEYHYVPATDDSTAYVETNVIDENTPNVTFSLSYDQTMWEPVGPDSGLHSIKRVGLEGNSIYIEFVKTDEFGYSTDGRGYSVDMLDYDVSFEQEIYNVFDDETSKELSINASGLSGKMYADYKVELGYIDDQSEEFVAFTNQSDLITAETSQPFIKANVNPSQLAELDTNGHQIFAKVTITSNGYEVSSAMAAIEIKKNVEELNVGFPENVILGNSYMSPLSINAYIENSESPDGYYDSYIITSAEIISGEDMITLDYSVEDDWIEIFATDLGEAEVRFTYERPDGSVGEVVMPFVVHEELYNVQVILDGGDTNAVIPGGLTQTVDVEVIKEMAYGEYEWDIDADIECGVATSEHEPYITFTKDPDKKNTFIIGAKEETPVGVEGWVVVYFNAYAVDENGNRIKDENNEDILLGTTEYEIRLTSDETCIVIDGFDEFAEVGEPRIVIPRVKHLYLDENGNYVEEYIKIDYWEFEYDPEFVSIVDNHDGSYTIERLEGFTIEISATGYVEDTESYFGTSLVFESLYGGDNPGFEDEQYIELTPEELLGSVQNGVITLTENVWVTGPITIDDGQDYVIDTQWYTLRVESEEDYGILVTDGSLEIIGVPNHEVQREGTLETSRPHAIVIDGTIDTAKVELGVDLLVRSEKETVYIKGGNLLSAANIGLTEKDENLEYYNPIKVDDKNNAKIELTNGLFVKDVMEYVAEGYTVGIWVNNPNTEDEGLMYWVMKIPTNDKELEETIYNEWVTYRDENGYYYENADAVAMANAKAEKFASWVELNITDEQGVSHMGDLLPVKDNESLDKWYELYAGVPLELPEYEGYHFAGWYESTFLEENDGKATYSETKVELTDPITKDMVLATKWCNAETTEVVGKTEPTYLVNGYTGDTVCAGCGKVFEKGEVIDKLVKLDAPEGMKVVLTSAGKPKVTWDAVDGATKYEVWRKVGETGEYKILITTTAKSLTNTSAVQGETYFYKVKAINGTNASNFSEEVVVTTGLKAPGNVKVTLTSAGKPKVTWDAVDGAAKYEVWRKAGETGEYKLLITTTLRSLTNTSAVKGETYSYKVKAINATESSKYSDEVGITSK